MIVSLKYAPGHLASITAFDSQSSAVFARPNLLLLSRKYAWMLSEDQSARSFFWGTSDSVRSMLLDCAKFLLFGWIILLLKMGNAGLDIVYFVNPHPLNPFLAALLKVRYPGCRIILHLHEPAPDTDSTSLVQRVYEAIIDVVQVLSLKIADDVVVSSENAREALKTRNLIPQSKVHLVPLLFEDAHCEHVQSRRFVTYVGHVSERRGIDTFLGCAAYCHARSIDLQFQIISKDNLQPFLESLPEEVRKKLTIVNKPDISNQEIADGLSRSIACCVIYKSKMMQSGVVPVALRSGTPVIVTRVGGLSEFVEEGKNAVILDPTAGPQELCDAALKIVADLEAMSKSARSRFEEIHLEDNWARYFDWLMLAGEMRSVVVSAD